MFRINRIILILLFFTMAACAPEKQSETNIDSSDVLKKTSEKVNLNIPTTTEGFTKIADTMLYTALIKNPNPAENEYMNKWLKGMDAAKFADIIMDALIAGKIDGYDYLTGQKMTVEEIKAFDTEYSRGRIGNVLFTEDWYFDEKNMTMHKVVNSVMFGYENRSPEGEVTGHKSGIRVYMNGFAPMKGALDE